MPCSVSLSRQEAARIWAKRDAEWEKERQARERLMKEVLAERQSQIEHKMDVLKSQQVRTCLWVWVGLMYGIYLTDRYRYVQLSPCNEDSAYYRSCMEMCTKLHNIPLRIHLFKRVLSSFVYCML